MYFLLYWIQNLRKAEPVGPERPADPSLAYSRWWEEGPPWGQSVCVQNSLCHPNRWITQAIPQGLAGDLPQSKCLFSIAELEETSPPCSQRFWLISMVPLATEHVLKRVQENGNNVTQDLHPQPAFQNLPGQHSLLFTWKDEVLRQLHISSR